MADATSRDPVSEAKGNRELDNPDAIFFKPQLRISRYVMGKTLSTLEFYRLKTTHFVRINTQSIKKDQPKDHA